MTMAMNKLFPEAELVRQALAYAGRGWRVLPVDGKIPILKEWPTHATTNPVTIRTWWTQRPTANVGIATGVLSGLLVLDVDPGNGGDDTLRALEAQHGALPDTIEAITGGNGRHYYFQHPEIDIKNSTGILGPGLDIRSEGGQVVAPPSVHPITRCIYAWEAAHHPDDVILASVPQWLLDKLTAKTEHTRSHLSTQMIPKGRRNDGLTREAGRLRHIGLNEIELEAALRAINNERCVPPLSDEEVLVIAASIARYPVGHTNRPQEAPPAEPPAEIPAGTFSPLSAPQLLDEPEPLQPEWVWEDFLPKGGLAALVAKPKVGKTTNACELAVKVAQGLPYLGRATCRGAVLVLAMEEHRREVRRRLRNLGADQLADVHMHIGPLADSPDTFHRLKQFIKQQRITLVILDTLNSFWSVQEENDAVAVTRAIKPLLALARGSGAAILLLHHARKSEGEFGDEIRGSGALFSLLDIALILKRHEIENQRRLTAISRYPETPRELIIELREHGHEALGDPTSVGKAAKLTRVQAALTDTPALVPEISTHAGVSKGFAYETLPRLAAQGLARQTGAGKRSDPHRYSKSVCVSPLRGGEANETNSSLDPNTIKAFLTEGCVSFGGPILVPQENKTNSVEDYIVSSKGDGGQTKRNEAQEVYESTEGLFAEEVVNDDH